MKIDCPKCKGNGYLPPDYPTPDGKLTLLCDECLGTGTVDVEVSFQALVRKIFSKVKA
jgi:DnaJ-class molecular chaperone